MTKAEIVSQISEQTGLAKKDVALTIEAFMKVVKDSVAKHKEDVSLRGFGTFIVKHRAAKTGRDMQKNITIRVEAHDIPGFKPSKEFTALMND
ncbi:integration host factor subunit beta [Prevotella sp. oral taxon 376]|uniref:HU family DNA-binding protein n=1 Tax=Prevotella sp. oral taxon 376 TaxID=712466 RepID=UPI000D1EE624|nr:HU family DNA-binding protein [Prevotella sp. oral taxon 376]PTL34426.1 integration host factor subunit beta [Prevotella sp. oral taxon 376]